MGRAACRQRGVPCSDVELRTRRVVVALDEVPSLLRRFVGDDTLHSLIDTEWAPARSALLSVTRNANCHGVGRFQEAAAYTPHPAAPDTHTLYLSGVEVAAATWVGRRVLSMVGSDGEAMIQSHVTLLRARLAEAFGPEAAPPPPPQQPPR